MRTEYVVRYIDNKGKNQDSVYSSKTRANDKFLKIKDWCDNRGYTIECWVTHWVGNSLHDAKKVY